MNANRSPSPASISTFDHAAWYDCLTIAVESFIIAAVLRPFQNTPFVDDWVYSWPVQHLVQTHRFVFPELVGNPILVQVLWGGLFSMVFGFSLAVLRVSTWVLAVVALCALYLLVRACRGDRRQAALAAAVLGVYPVFFILAPTFMTDVPALALMITAAAVFVQALNRQSDRLVWIASACCAASVGCRMVGVGVAAAMIATLLFHMGGWGRRVRIILAPVLVLPFAGWLLIWTRTRVFRSADVSWLPNGPQQRFGNLRVGLQLLPSMVPEAMLFAGLVVGLALVPLAVASFRRASMRRLLWPLLTVFASWAVLRANGLSRWSPLAPGEMWSLRQLGAAAAFVPGWLATPVPPWVSGLLTVGALASVSVLLAARMTERLTPSDKFLLWNILAQVMIIATLWLTYDRCALAIVAFAIVLVLSKGQPVHVGRAIVCLFVYAAICLAGTHDYLAYNRALWNAVADLRAAGVPAADIDGGYVVNGWLQYLHPEQAYRDAAGQIIVPMVNDVAELPYTIANRPLPDRTVVATYAFARWLDTSGQIYVLKR